MIKDYDKLIKELKEEVLNIEIEALSRVETRENIALTSEIFHKVEEIIDKYDN